jgi:hypothetical protein
MLNSIYSALAPAVTQAVANGAPNTRFDVIDFYGEHDLGSPTTPEAFEFAVVVEKLRSHALTQLAGGAAHE